MVFLAAQAIFWVHIAIIAFNVFGLIAIPLGVWLGWAFIRVPWWRLLHLAALLVVALQAVLGRACFLTLWESDLAARAGETSSNLPLIQEWIARLVFWPLPIWMFALFYVAIFLYVVALWVLVPPRWSRRLAR
ncbi:MAG TPA: DUF2784 family protein [Stellaceae bacterium]|nr:DUF2784 family protein [Stellaceae bacterium]